jgi:hypothetical protein
VLFPPSLLTTRIDDPVSTNLLKLEQRTKQLEQIIMNMKISNESDEDYIVDEKQDVVEKIRTKTK